MMRIRPPTPRPSQSRVLGQQPPQEEEFLQQKTPNWINLVLFVVAIAYTANNARRLKRLEKKAGLRPGPDSAIGMAAGALSNLVPAST